MVGDHSSLTVLIDGFCYGTLARANQLDLPTEEQILAALRGLLVVNYGSLPTRQLQASAFRILLQTAKPVPADHLTAGVDAGITSSIEDLQRSGHIRLDPNGCFVGALGLSLRPTMHGLSIDGSKLWARCALDVIGIFGFLRRQEHPTPWTPRAAKIFSWNSSMAFLRTINTLSFCRKTGLRSGSRV